MERHPSIFILRNCGKTVKSNFNLLFPVFVRFCLVKQKLERAFRALDMALVKALFEGVDFTWIWPLQLTQLFPYGLSRIADACYEDFLYLGFLGLIISFFLRHLYFSFGFPVITGAIWSHFKLSFLTLHLQLSQIISKRATCVVYTVVTFLGQGLNFNQRLCLLKLTLSGVWRLFNLLL